VVLTYSAPDALVDCTRAVLGQDRAPDRVIVVDNDGWPTAADALAAADIDSPIIEILRTPSNGGPAEGHAVGLQHFLDSDCDIAWVMDDDCVPEQACLNTLLTDSVDDHSVFRYPTWIQPDGTASDVPAWCGFVIGRDLVQGAGLPRADLFWWGEDTEYLQWRVRRLLGHPTPRSPTAVVRHTRVRAGRHRPGWKYYYEARNTVYLRTRHRRHMNYIPRILIKLFGRIVLVEDHKLVKTALFARGIFDGVFGRMGVRVTVPRPVARG
jgi:GT2 family glycosyltransferase